MCVLSRPSPSSRRCSGPSRRSGVAFGGLGLRAFAACFVWASLFTPVDAVGCIHCRDSIAGCGGGDQCPLVKGVASNAEAMARQSLAHVPSLVKLLPSELLSVFTRTVVEAITGIASLPVGGGEVDLSSATYSTSHSVVSAVTSGHITSERAVSELSRRLEAATTEVEVRKIGTSIDLLKGTSGGSEYAGATGYGVYTFIWAKVGAFMDAAKSGIVKLPGAAVKTATAAAAELKATIRRPSSQCEFLEMLHIWQMVVHSVGLVSYLIIAPFVMKVVFDTMTRLGKSWQFAHEFLLVHLRAIETDTSSTLNIGNILLKGHRDMYFAEAANNVLMLFSYWRREAAA